jgi:hypothetical protein
MKNRNLENHNNWKTPKDLYDALDAEFHFDFDPCPYKHDLMLWDGLSVEWGGVNFVNPPYSRKEKEAFVRKALVEKAKGRTSVLLLPVSTSTALFHDVIQPHCEIRFLRGRPKFEGENTKGEFVTTKAGMHDSMVCVMRGDLLNTP